MMEGIMGRASGAGKGFQDRRKHEAAILRAEDGLCGPLGVRHQSKDIAPLIADAGDMIERAVGVRLFRRVASLVAIAKDNLVVVDQPLEGLPVDVVPPFAVRDRHSHHLPALHPPSEWGVLALHPYMDPLAAIVQTVVPQERAWEQPGLRQDLKPVAAPEHEAALLGEPRHLSHDGRKSRNCAGPEVVAMGEAPGQDHAIGTLEVGLLVPEIARLLFQDIRNDMIEVLLAPGTREDHDAKLHPSAPSSSKA